MSDVMLAKFKKFALNGIAQMFLAPPIDLDTELVALKADIEALPLDKEKFNEEDRSYQNYFQLQLGWKVEMLAKFTGINGNFAKGAWNTYRYALSLISSIAADEQLLEIGKKLEIITDKALQSVANQNAGNFYYQYYLHRITETK